MSHSFAGELRRVMLDRGIRCREVSAALGISLSSVVRWRSGQSMPMHDMVTRLGDLLACEALVTFSLRARLGACEVCHRPFVSQGRGPNRRRFCGERCQQVSRYRRKREAVLDTIAFSRIRLSEHQEAVAAFCMTCEPEGLCRTADCPLRAVSPLPFMARVAA